MKKTAKQKLRKRYLLIVFLFPLLHILLSQHYLQVYDDIQRLNQYYYEDHMQQLQEKVIKQRQEIKKKAEEMESKQKEKEFSKVLVARLLFFTPKYI